MIKNQYILVFLFVLVGVIVISLLSRSASSKYNKAFIRQIQTVVKKALKNYNQTQQDTNLLTGLTNNVTGLTQAHLARNLTSDEHIQKITKVNITELIYYLDKQQTDILSKIYNACPSLKTPGTYSITT